MLSIVGRLEDGKHRALEYSCLHSGYNERRTLLKLEHALDASGPRTCENINAIWGGCHQCKYKDKVKSPIVIKGKDYIKTKDTGFYHVITGEDGKIKRGKPCFEDLLKFFNNEHTFVTTEEAGMIYIFDDTQWTYYPVTRINEFAEKNFCPSPTTPMVTEFRSKMQRNNVVSTSWWDKSIDGKINFANGVLDLNTMILSAHDPDLGFKYTLPFDYNPKAECPRFDRYMNEVTVKDTQ
jgi:hypothetical protein